MESDGSGGSGSPRTGKWRRGLRKIRRFFSLRRKKERQEIEVPKDEEVSNCNEQLSSVDVHTDVISIKVKGADCIHYLSKATRQFITRERIAPHEYCVSVVDVEYSPSFDENIVQDEDLLQCINFDEESIKLSESSASNNSSKVNLIQENADVKNVSSDTCKNNQSIGNPEVSATNSNSSNTENFQNPRGSLNDQDVQKHQCSLAENVEVTQLNDSELVDSTNRLFSQSINGINCTNIEEDSKYVAEGDINEGTDEEIPNVESKSIEDFDSSLVVEYSLSDNLVNSMSSENFLKEEESSIKESDGSLGSLSDLPSGIEEFSESIEDKVVSDLPEYSNFSSGLSIQNYSNEKNSIIFSEDVLQTCDIHLASSNETIRENDAEDDVPHEETVSEDTRSRKELITPPISDDDNTLIESLSGSEQSLYEDPKSNGESIENFVHQPKIVGELRKNDPDLTTDIENKQIDDEKLSEINKSDINLSFQKIQKENDSDKSCIIGKKIEGESSSSKVDSISSEPFDVLGKSAVLVMQVEKKRRESVHADQVDEEVSVDTNDAEIYDKSVFDDDATKTFFATAHELAAGFVKLAESYPECPETLSKCNQFIKLDCDNKNKEIIYGKPFKAVSTVTTQVNPGSKAASKGIREGDLITSINNEPTKNLTNAQSHALLRTVKENLLLGLNQDATASPRRRSRSKSNPVTPAETPSTPKGVWSPAGTPEAERKHLDFSSFGSGAASSANKEENEEEAAPVWTPRSAGASPVLERKKYRPINYQSPTPQRKHPQLKHELEPELPKDLPKEPRFTTDSSSHRLPSSQNPTITLLQKAREGQLPKGAQYLDERISESTISQDHVLYSVKKEYESEDSEEKRKIVELTPRKFEGIGPTTKEGTPIALRSEVKEDNQQRWYKRMYDSLHKAEHDKDYVTVRYSKRKGLVPYTSQWAGSGYLSEPDRLTYDSDTKYSTLDRRRSKSSKQQQDYTLPRNNRYSAAVRHAVNVYKNQPGRIEDYEPGHSSISEKEKQQWWDDVLEIFNGELKSAQAKSESLSPSFDSRGRPFTSVFKEGGYDSDSTLVFSRRSEGLQDLSLEEQRMAYKSIQKGGDVPLHGLRKPPPTKKEPYLRGGRFTPSIYSSPESNREYLESEVNIHYRTPVRHEAKEYIEEGELARRQAEAMRRIYQQQRRNKYIAELNDIHSRRHTDYFTPSQKSPIPLNRYDDFLAESAPPRPRDRTPEPKLVARALYNFVGQSSRELTFRRGDIIFVRRQVDKNWYEGEHNAMIGLFPINYVEIIPYDGIRTLPKKSTEGQARAKFNFQAQTHLELSLVKGELVLLTRRVDENWFEGRIGNKKGIFPVSYVQVLVEPGEVTYGGGKPVVAPASHSVMLNGAKDLGSQIQPPRPPSVQGSPTKPKESSQISQLLHIDTRSDPIPYRAMYNYKPQNDDELELREGDIVYVMEKCDDGWYVGSLHRNGQFGTFPGNYVQRIP